MELRQILDLQLTQEEIEQMGSLLKSKNSPKIMYVMMRNFAGISDENTQFLMKTIPDLANVVIDRANARVTMKQKAIETLEAVMPAKGKPYPYGMFGVLTFILAQCNFMALYDPENAWRCLASRHMTGSPSNRMMIPVFREFVDQGEALWEDHAWMMLDQCGYGEQCRSMVRWCLDNREKWDDIRDEVPND